MKTIPKIILALLLFLLPIAGRAAFFYRGRYVTPPAPQPDLQNIEIAMPAMGEFVDYYEEGQGTVLFDLAHENNYTTEELSVLLSRLTARGYKAEFWEENDDLSDKLRYANALVVISPAQGFSHEKIQQVEEFVDKGGKLLLVTDPTRFKYIYDEYGMIVGFKSDSPNMNSLATSFGIVFEDDYLYNMVENEGNYQNIILRDFQKDPLTTRLEQVVLYAAHSISSQESKLILADENTFSSLSGWKENPATAVLARGGRVLAISDLTFMTKPYNDVLDNNQLISNIADFLTELERRYLLTDFPYFFAEEVDLVYTASGPFGSAIVEQSSALQKALSRANRRLALRDEEDRSRDTLFMGLYTEAEAVEKYLKAKDISLIPPEEEEKRAEKEETPIEEKETATPEIPEEAEGIGKEEGQEKGGRIEIKGIGQLEMNGTALLCLEEKAGRHVLIVLAISEESLATALEMLALGDISRCLVNNNVALCPTGELLLPEEEIPLYEATPSPTSEEEIPSPPPLSEGTETPTVESAIEATPEPTLSPY